MFRQYVRGHRSAVLTGVVATVVGAVVATSAVVSSGYHAQRVDLGDGTVWVPSAQYGAVGRADTGVLQLNTAIQASTDALQVVQHGSTVYSVDATRATVAKVDVADATLGDPVSLPSGTPRVFVAGDTAVIGNADTGQLWSTPTRDLDRFDATARPDLTLGADAAFDADDRDVAVYSPRTGRASLVTVGQTLQVARTADVRISRRHDVQVAAVGTHLAVLDRTAATLAVDGRTVDLAGRVRGAVALQQSAMTGDDVVVASAAGLLRVSTGGSVTTVALPVSGTAARPYVDGTCTYAAWGGGQALDTCDGRAVQRLSDVPGGAELTVQHNGATIVANDPDSGRTWAIDRSGQLIDNWGDLVQRDDDQREQQTSDDDPQLDTTQMPPVAVDDALGARPGRTTILPVLLNDYDPNGDPLVIDRVGGVADAVGSVALINNRQQLQITLSARVTGTVRFDYDISDGNGGTASATVTVTVRQPTENGPPAQVRDTSAQVVQNGHVSTDVLPDWVDPDGDPVYLAGATAPGGDAVTTTPDGSVGYRDTSGKTGRRTVALVVSDGRASGRGALEVTVSPQGRVGLEADSFALTAYAGSTETIRPLEHAHGGNGTVMLSSVPSIVRATVTPSYDAGTVAFVSNTPGEYRVEYTVTDGTKTASGIARVSVFARPDASTVPITTPKTVFVDTLSTKDTDVTATDIDPAGGVLLVTGLTGVQVRSGLQASVLDQHTVRVTLTAPLDGPVSFRYQETNGIASATGSVTVVEIPKPDHVQPPVAQPDSATVRVGDVATIEVLANDTQPDGEALTLEPELVQNLPGDAGLLFVSGDTLRYLAPSTPGNYTAVYRVDGPDGQHADAVVSIAVREEDATTNAPPVPTTITARVIAGHSVRIAVPLSGIDPDGDSVQLVGVASNPDRGSVSDVTTTSLVYDAGDYSAGTDEFTYTVVDALGARATGTIRVGVAPRVNGASNPVAQADHVTIRPGGSVTVRVLENDSDPDGGRLTVRRVEPNGKRVRARIVDGREIRVTPPATATHGDFAVLYTAANDGSGTSTAYLTVTVDRDAQPLRPEASDTVLDLQDILHRRTVSVDVLRNVFFAEGTHAQLRVGLVDRYAQNAQVSADGRVQVDVTDHAQVIPFSVSRRDHPEIVSYAFIQVPGFDDALPQVNRTAPALTVKSEATVRIPLSRYVVTANGGAARISDSGTVKATHANGADLVADPSTLVFTSAKLYYGNASISFEVTDGSDANGGRGRTATLVLPIKVTPRANQAPAFTGGSLDVQPGEPRTIDLTKLTDYPYPRDVPELRYSVTSHPADGTTATLSGQRLTVSVADTTPKGSTAAIGIGVADATNTGRSGIVVVRIVGSTRPLVQPAADRAVVRRGQTTTVDVLANDAATNPFPGEPLHVVAIRGLEGGVPAGVTITPSADRSRLTVAVAGNARPVDTNLQYQVADATGDTDRSVWGTMTVSVQDVPDAPSVPARTGTFQGGELTLAWNAPDGNNSPITDYRVTGTNGYQRDCGTSTVCRITDLDPSQRSVFTVTAINAVGTSKPSAPSAPLGADYVPAVATGIQVVPAEDTPNAVDVRWNVVPRPNGGTPVSSYSVTLTGPSGTQSRTTTAPAAQFSGLQAGGLYTATVSARNAAQVDSDADWNRASGSGTAVGTPGAPQDVTARGTRSATGDNTDVTITYAAADPAGATALTYAVYRVATQTGSCTAPGGTRLAAGRSGTVDTDVYAEGALSYAVVATSDVGGFCSIAYSGTVQTSSVPSKAEATVRLSSDRGSGTFRIAISDLQATGREIDHWEVDYGEGWSSIPQVGVVTAGQGFGTQSSVSVRACPADVSYCGPGSDPVVLTAVRTRAAITGLPTQGQQLPPLTAPDNGELSSGIYHITFCPSDAAGCTTVDVPIGSEMPMVPADAATVSVATQVLGQVDPNPPEATVVAVVADPAPEPTPPPEPDPDPTTTPSDGADPGQGG